MPRGRPKKKSSDEKKPRGKSKKLSNLTEIDVNKYFKDVQSPTGLLEDLDWAVKCNKDDLNKITKGLDIDLIENHFKKCSGVIITYIVDMPHHRITCLHKN